jgi:hypothetical protein
MSTFALTFWIVMFLAAGLGIAHALESTPTNDPTNDPRSSAQRRAQREDCRSKGL